MADRDASPDDLAHLSPEDRAIVLRGRALLDGLKDKPKVSKELQERSESVNMDLESLRALVAKNPPPEG
jgi:hypothetical protein